MLVWPGLVSRIMCRLAYVGMLLLLLTTMTTTTTTKPGNLKDERAGVHVPAGRTCEVQLHEDVAASRDWPRGIALVIARLMLHLLECSMVCRRLKYDGRVWKREGERRRNLSPSLFDLSLWLGGARGGEGFPLFKKKALVW